MRQKLLKNQTKTVKKLDKNCHKIRQKLSKNQTKNCKRIRQKNETKIRQKNGQKLDKNCQENILDYQFQDLLTITEKDLRHPRFTGLGEWVKRRLLELTNQSVTGR